MNLLEWHALASRKVARYDAAECVTSLAECHHTLKVFGSDIGEDWGIKIWAEIDALRERQRSLSEVAA